MGAAAYNRGSKLISREADMAVGGADARAEREAVKAERAALLAQIARLERDLGRARRCIAELRRSKDERLAEARAEVASSAASIRILTRLAFPHDGLIAEAERLEALARSAFHRAPDAPETHALMAQCRAAWKAVEAAR